jgi:hypothetical protein
MLPSIAFQVTEAFDAVPCTAALNCSVPPVTDEPAVGDTVTEVTPVMDDGPDPVDTVTVAVADLVGSATLVAVIVPVPCIAGAVNIPALVIAPIEADHLTELFVVVP